jgi:hypothetical protein
MPKRGLAFLLANVMFWQPMWAQADGIVVSKKGTDLFCETRRGRFVGFARFINKSVPFFQASSRFI